MAKLTDTQFRYAMMLARGRDPEQIARLLGKSESTVWRVLVRARRVAGARTNTQLAVMVAVRFVAMKFKAKQSERVKIGD